MIILILYRSGKNKIPLLPPEAEYYIALCSSTALEKKYKYIYSV